MNDLVRLKGLRVVGRHGVLDEERGRAQPFEIDVDLEVSGRRAGHSDDLAHTVDYGKVALEIRDVVETESHELLERLAERLAEKLLAHDGLEAVTVEVRKLRPPIPVDVAWAGVRIRRECS